MKITKSSRSGLEAGMILPIYSDYKNNITPKNIEFFAKLIEIDYNSEPLTFIIRDEPDCRQTIYSAERWLVEVSSSFKTYRYLRFTDRTTIHSSSINIKKIALIDDIEFDDNHIKLIQKMCNFLYPDYNIEIKPKNIALFKSSNSICVGNYEREGCKYWRNLIELCLFYIPNILFRKNSVEYLNFLKSCIVIQETHPVIYLDYFFKKTNKNDKPEGFELINDDLII